MPIAVQATSDLELYLDWTFTDSIMSTFIAIAPCDGDMFNNDQCSIIQQTSGTTPKPRTTIARRVAVGSYVFLILNSGPRSESFSYQIFSVTPPSTSSASLPSQVVGATALPSTVVAPFKRRK